MKWWSRLTVGSRALLGRARVEQSLDEELRQFVEASIEQKIAAGLSREDAIRRAHAGAGSLAAAKDYVRDVGWEAHVDAFLADLSIAARALRKNRGFAAIAILTLTLGIGANTAVFTLLDAVLLKPLAVPRPHELVTFYETPPEGVEGRPDLSGGQGRFMRFSFPRFEQLSAAIKGHGSLAAMTATTELVARVSGRSDLVRVKGQLVSGSYFGTLGIPPARGRAFDDSDVRDRLPALVAVVSEGFWRRSLDGSDSAIGRTLVVNDTSVTVVGVMPPGFIGVWTDVEPDIWLPVTLQHELGLRSNSSSYGNTDRTRPWVSQDSIAWLTLVGRIDSAGRTAVISRLEAVNHDGMLEMSQAWEEKFRTSMRAQRLMVEPLSQGFSGLRGQFSTALWVLSGIVGVVLCVTCANIANLLLVRGARRARDIAVRRALGATTGRLIRQLLTENLLIAVIGGVTGLVAGVWGSRLLASQVLSTSALPSVFAPDGRVLAFTAIVSVFTVAAFGLLPAFRAARPRGQTNVSLTAREGVGSPTMRGMRPLLAGQIALSVIIVFAAMLLGRTLINYVRLDPGYTAHELVTVALEGYSPERGADRAVRVRDAIKAVPGITSAARSVCGLGINCSFSAGAQLAGRQGDVSTFQNWVDSGYFSAVGIPVLTGREFNSRDTSSSPHVAVVSASLARQYFQGRSAVGQRLVFHDKNDVEIVGVVGDTRSRSLRVAPAAMTYFPIEQQVFASHPIYPYTLDVRVTGHPALAVPAIRAAAQAAGSGLQIGTVQPTSARLSRSVQRERIVAYLAAGFAFLALVLASVGLYGVLSYLVASRNREIGVRMALGATRGGVLGLVLRQGAVLTVTGLAIGLAGASALTRYLQGMLFEVAPLDPLTFAGVTLAFGIVAALASYIPARRATEVDPLVALRSE